MQTLYKLYSESYLVDIDTRTIREGSIFFAIKGEKFNGNEFVEQALEKGASYAVIDQSEYKINDQTILVKDALKTLQQLATYHRNKLGIPIIALTGSNGKTTTKELINQVLSEKFMVTATKGNFNNHIGVPLTLLSMTPETEIGVVEMGANHKNEIKFLSEIVRPDYGLITNFGKAHLEGFGSMEGIIKGKSELYDFLRDNGKAAIVNSNDSLQVLNSRGINRIFISESIKLNSVSPYLSLSFENLIIKSNLVGDYNFNNIAIAIAIGSLFDITPQQIKIAIERYVPTNNRSQIIQKGELKIVLDAYNANPSSMKYSIESFSNINGEYKMVILGDMFELGEYSDIEHQKIVDLLIEHNFDKCCLVGDLFYKTRSPFEKFHSFDNLKNFIKENPIEKGNILIKGSRGMSLERVLEFI